MKNLSLRNEGKNNNNHNALNTCTLQIPPFYKKLVNSFKIKNYFCASNLQI